MILFSSFKSIRFHQIYSHIKQDICVDMMEEQSNDGIRVGEFIFNERIPSIQASRRQGLLTYELKYYKADAGNPPLPEYLSIKVITSTRIAKTYFMIDNSSLSFQNFARLVQSEQLQEINSRLLCYQEQSSVLLLNHDYELSPHLSGDYMQQQPDECEMKAMLGACIIQFIWKLYGTLIGSEKTFLQLLTDYVVRQLGKLWTINMYNLLRKYFEFKEGMSCADHLNQKVYTQKFFKNGCTKKKLIYFPTFVTTKMFYKIIQQDYGQFITGQSGIGKSISFCLYTRLYNQLIEPFLMRGQFSKMEKFFRMERFKAFPKIFYLSIPQKKFIREKEIKALIIQARCKLDEQAAFCRILQQIKQYYLKKGIQCHLVVDQINIFTSLRRRKYCEKSFTSQQAQSIDKQYFALISFIDLLSSAFSTIIFNSSMNVEVKAPRGQKQFDFFESIPTQDIEYWSNIDSTPRCIERLRMLEFQLNRLVITLNKPNLIEPIKNLFKRIIASPISSTVKTIGRQITHHSINQYFNLKISVYSTLVSGSLDEDFIEDILLKIHAQALEKQAEKFQKFLENGPREQDKLQRYLLLEQIQRQAYYVIKHSQTDNLEHTFYVKNISHIHPFNINSDKMYHNNGSLTIFTSPQVFLAMSSKIARKTTIVEKMLKYFTEQEVGAAQFGLFADRFYTKAISKERVRIILDGAQYSLDGKNCFFQHFHKSEPHYIFEDKFSSVLQALRESNQKGKWIGASPVFQKKKNIIIPQPVKSSFSSWCLDGLLMKSNEEENSFNIVTLDFCVGFTNSYIKDKLQKSHIFFKRLQQTLSSNTEGLKLFVHHYIIAPRQKVLYFQENNQPTKIEISSKKSKRMSSKSKQNTIDIFRIPSSDVSDVEQSTTSKESRMDIQLPRNEVFISAKVSLYPIEDFLICFDSDSTMQLLTYKYIQEWLEKHSK